MMKCITIFHEPVKKYLIIHFDVDNKRANPHFFREFSIFPRKKNTPFCLMIEVRVAHIFLHISSLSRNYPKKIQKLLLINEKILNSRCDVIKDEREKGDEIDK